MLQGLANRNKATGSTKGLSTGHIKNLLPRMPKKSQPLFEPDDDDEPVSPEEPDQASLEQAIKGQSNDLLASYYNKTKGCPCHGKTHAESFDRVWELPPSKDDKEGVTRVVAEVRAAA